MVKPENSNYESKLNQAVSATMREWWDGLSKEDLLTYMAEQPQITADFIRQMLANENCVLGIGMMFSVTAKEARSNFHADQR